MIPMGAPERAPRPRRHQRGIALLILLLVLVVAGSGLFLAIEPGGSAQRSEAARSQAEELASARRAVIAYALAGGTAGTDRPGALPCPDSTDPSLPAGHSDYKNIGTANSFDCINNTDDDVQLFRLPYRTLDIAGLEHDLWFAIDLKLHNEPDNTINPKNARPGGLELFPNPGATLGAGDYAAVIIAPGAPLVAESPPPDQRGRPSTNKTDYLEDRNVDDATNQQSAKFVDCPKTEGCNDRVAAISINELFMPVRIRLLGYLENRIRDYYVETGGVLPFAHSGTDVDQPCIWDEPDGRLPLSDQDCKDSSPFVDESEGFDFFFDLCSMEQWVRPAPDDADSFDHAGCLPDEAGNGWLQFIDYRLVTRDACIDPGAASICTVELTLQRDDLDPLERLFNLEPPP